MARAAFEMALEFAQGNTAGAIKPIINFQNVGYVLGDVAAKIEMGRYFSWRAADYLDKHDQHAELGGAMNKIQVTELMFDCVYKCMQIVGVNSLEVKNGFGKILREASVLPIYDGGMAASQTRQAKEVTSQSRLVLEHIRNQTRTAVVSAWVITGRASSTRWRGTTIGGPQTITPRPHGSGSTI